MRYVLLTLGSFAFLYWFVRRPRPVFVSDATRRRYVAEGDTAAQLRELLEQRPGSRPEPHVPALGRRDDKYTRPVQERG